MSTPLITIIAITLLGLFYVTLPIVADAFLRYRKKRVLSCPETGGLAEVDIHAPRAAFTSLLGQPRLRVKNCILWPERKGCGESCLK